MDGLPRSPSLDPELASALHRGSFDGWCGAPRFALPASYVPLPVVPPQTYLLRIGWHAHGAIDPFEVPAQWRDLGKLT